MKNLVLVVAGASMLFSACKKEIIKPSLKITTIERSVEQFTSVEVADAMDVTISYASGEQKVVVEANSNVHSCVMTEVVGGKLKIYLKKNVIFRKSTKIKVHLTLPELVSLKVTDASEVSFTNQFEANHIDIDASGASEISGGLNALSATITLSGASEADFHGVSSIATFHLSGASTFDSFSFHTNELTANLSGASEAFVRVNDHLNLLASGASEFHYSGDCSIGQLNLTGASTIEKH